MNLNKIILVVSCIALVISSCGEKKDSDSDKKPVKTEERQVDTLANQDSYSAFDHEHHSLPSPLQIALLFRESGLYFDQSVVDVSYQDGTNYQALLSMGKLTAQMAYTGLNGEKDIALKAMEGLSRLSDQTGFGNVLITNERLAVVEQNIDQPDSMIQYMSDMQYDLDKYIVENEEEDRSLIVFTAAWIETLEMGRKLLSIELSEALILQLLDQHSIAHSLVELLKANKSFSDNKSYQKLVSGVEKIEDALSAFGDLSGDEVEIEQKTFDTLTSTIELVHKEIFE